MIEDPSDDEDGSDNELEDHMHVEMMVSGDGWPTDASETEIEKDHDEDAWTMHA